MDHRIRVGAVSYLNSVPLIWGMQNGPQREQVDLRFAIPARCAEEIEQNITQIGLVPVAEIARQQLKIVSDVGISCLGAVRSILLCSRKPISQIRTLSVDASSRTSVHLAEIILRERYGVRPAITRARPDLEMMLQSADAALVIGDPALLIDPENSRYETLDLGSEWLALTQLPMVFAVWAGKAGLPEQVIRTMTRDSFLYGRKHLTEAIAVEAAKRGVNPELAFKYLTEYIRFEIGPEQTRGLEVFYELAGLSQKKVMA